MQQGTSVWDILAPFGTFFSQLGTDYVSRADDPGASSFGVDGVFYTEPTPAILTLQNEVVNGWSVSSIVQFWGPLYVVAVFFSLLFLTGILYCVIRILQVRRIERAALIKAANPVRAEDIPRTQLRWQRILEQSASEDDSQWRLAILEADIMLNDLLDTLGYKGETMADKMKQVDVTVFNAIDYAWEAHKIRNIVAHEGSKYELNAREARRVIRMYERVFREFKFVE